LVTVDTTSEALNLDNTAAAKLLSRWVQQGWLKRIHRGLYTPVPITSSPNSLVIEDAWTLVPQLFKPAYVCGATAAQFWNLTEQLFRTVFVYTAQPVRQAEQIFLGTPFSVHHVPARLIFGTRPVWRGQIKIEISDIHRTIIDILDKPSIGGGIRHVADCLSGYLTRDDADIKQLINYAEQLKNGAVFKRLGFLAECIGQAELVSACSARLSQGNAKLDPALSTPRLIRRWRLWVTEKWKGQVRLND